MAELYPAFIRDNPIMQGAFSAFMNWIWREESAHKAHCEATGMSPLLPRRSPIERMVDEATGHDEAYAASFARWAIDTQWGVEGRDDTPEAIAAYDAEMSQ